MSMFSKRHYEAFASMMKRNHPGIPTPSGDRAAWVVWLKLRNDTAEMFAKDSPSFDREKFLKSCQPKDS